MNQAHIESSGASRGSLKSYITGFILSIVLTGIAFALVMSGMFSDTAVLFGIFAAAVVQILVHLHYFLHLDASSAMRWNVLALLLTLLIMTLFVWGTLWIMGHLNYRIR
ncbi:MAG: cytochrome o ubiquinol oxidase subunit IV [Deltaproteobacteria bacterium]|jgi:cytochrome o ubiquinol oxidase operon protein cyoD